MALYKLYLLINCLNPPIPIFPADEWTAGGKKGAWREHDGTNEGKMETGVSENDRTQPYKHC